MLVGVGMRDAVKISRRALFACLAGALVAVPLVGKAASRYALVSVPKRYAMSTALPQCLAENHLHPWGLDDPENLPQLRKLLYPRSDD